VCLTFRYRNSYELCNNNNNKRKTTGGNGSPKLKSPNKIFKKKLLPYTFFSPSTLVATTWLSILPLLFPSESDRLVTIVEVSSFVAAFKDTADGFGLTFLEDLGFIIEPSVDGPIVVKNRSCKLVLYSSSSRE
jgi:hypothetical protein